MELYFLIKKDIDGNLRYLIAASCGLFKLLCGKNLNAIIIIYERAL
jgi:hypothetical protein